MLQLFHLHQSNHFHYYGLLPGLAPEGQQRSTRQRVSDSDLIIQYGGPLPKRINSGKGDSAYEGAGDARRLA